VLALKIPRIGFLRSCIPRESSRLVYEPFGVVMAWKSQFQKETLGFNSGWFSGESVGMYGELQDLNHK